jgi:hypothetical protein
MQMGKGIGAPSTVVRVSTSFTFLKMRGKILRRVKAAHEDASI